MPSVFSHAIAAVAVGGVAVGGPSRLVIWGLGAGLASIMTVLLRRTRMASPGGARLWAFFFLATSSHGVLDAMTNGGLGVAFFAPFSDVRYFFPWRPIIVSPISVAEFFGPRGLRVMWSELGWVWLPAAVVFLAGLSKWSVVIRHRDREGQP